MQFSINSCFVTVQDVPVTSAITDPPAGASIDPDEDEVTLKGYAWSGRCAPAPSKAFSMHGWLRWAPPMFCLAGLETLPVAPACNQLFACANGSSEHMCVGINERRQSKLTVAFCWCERSGNGIIRVDITADGGKSWTSANLQHHELGQKHGRCTMCIGGVPGIAVTVVCLHLPDAYGSRRSSAKQGCQRESCFCGVRSEWAWTLWDVTLPLQKADRSKPLQLAVRAVDAAYNAQPEVTSLCKT